MRHWANRSGVEYLPYEFAPGRVIWSWPPAHGVSSLGPGESIQVLFRAGLEMYDVLQAETLVRDHDYHVKCVGGDNVLPNGTVRPPFKSGDLKSYVPFRHIVHVQQPVPDNGTLSHKAAISIPLGAYSRYSSCGYVDRCLSPVNVTVAVGGEVTWYNNDRARHYINSGTDDQRGTYPDNVFRSGWFINMFSHTFEEAGKYHYHGRARWMEGVVTVVGPPAQPGNATGPPAPVEPPAQPGNATGPPAPVEPPAQPGNATGPPAPVEPPEVVPPDLGNGTVSTTAEVSNAPGSSVPGCEETNECFIPSNVTIAAGGTVTWTNDDTAAHTVTSGAAGGGGPDGTFDSPLLLPNAVFAHTFEDAGEYPYFCVVHPWRQGIVTVDGLSPPRPPTVVVPPPAGRLQVHVEERYVAGDIMNVSGSVGVFETAVPVVITVVAPNNNIIVVEQVTLSIDGTFSTQIGVGGQHWRAYGVYVVVVQYGTEVASATFEFASGGSGDGSLPPAPAPPGNATAPPAVRPTANLTSAVVSEDGVTTGTLPDGTLVELTVRFLADQRTADVIIEFRDSEHVNYDIVAMQGGRIVLEDISAHDHDGVNEHRTAQLMFDPGERPLYVTVTFNGYGLSELTGATGVVVFAGNATGPPPILGELVGFVVVERDLCAHYDDGFVSCVPGNATGLSPVPPGNATGPPPAVTVPVVVELRYDDPAEPINVTGFGVAADLTIDVGGLARSALDGTASSTVTFPPSETTVAASFVAVSFPPSVTATHVPADGLITVRVSATVPSNERVQGALAYEGSGRVTLQRVVEVGSGTAGRVMFDMPVRIFLEGQAGGRAFYIDGADGAITPIDEACVSDDVDRVHGQLDGAGECQVDSADGGKAIYTYHLTRFGTALPEHAAPLPTIYTCAAGIEAADLDMRAAPGGYSEPVRQVISNRGTLAFERVDLVATPWHVDPAAGLWADADTLPPVLPTGVTEVLDMDAGDDASGYMAVAEGTAVARGLEGGDVASLLFRLNLTPHGGLQGATMVQNVTYQATCGPP